MAVATSAEYVPTGIMGIGLDRGESLAASGVVYPNLLDEMVNQKLINARAYSLWLDDLEANTGTVLFGGYDSEKFSGDLTALELQPDVQTGNITSFTVAWTSLSITNDDSVTIFLTPNGFAAPTMLDSGTTLTSLPQDLYNSVATYVGAVDSTSSGPLVLCNISSYQGTLSFGFGGDNGPRISVPFSELALPAADPQGKPLTFEDGSPACRFGLFASSETLFGHTFLRSAYVVYDLDALKIGIAPIVYSSTSSNVTEINPGPGGLAASSIASEATVKQTGTASIAPGLVNSDTATAVPTKVPKPTF